MTLLELLLLILVAGICGGLAQAVVGFGRGGCFAAIALGFVGALIGSWLARTLDLPAVLVLEIGGVLFPTLWAFVGAALFVALLSLISGKRT